ncbi:outer spore wall assembly protein [Acrasis kona]|uniref:Outer spore wall assembly protein n=1 Tax=Acrasis kona TaxID=1008807 RepID=A0AAW2YWR8_9EUKA
MSKFAATSHDDANVNYLNNISKAFDFLYKNYVNYTHKLSYKSEKTSQDSVLVKRLKPLFIREKFDLAKNLLVTDLQDAIEASTIQIMIYKQQIHQLQRRSPPSIFLNSAKYSPYYWILTDVDYTKMHPVIRDIVLYYRKSDTTTAMNDKNKQMLETFLTRDNSIQRRYAFLLSRFLSQQLTRGEDYSELIRSEQCEVFEKFCHSLLSKRAKNIRSKVKKIKKDSLRVVERERSRHLSEYSRLKSLVLLEPDFGLNEVD